MISDYDIVQAMIVHGGSFVQQLGRAWSYADSHNQAKLKAAFPKYWQQYARMADTGPRRYRIELQIVDDTVPVVGGDRPEVVKTISLGSYARLEDAEIEVDHAQKVR